MSPDALDERGFSVVPLLSAEACRSIAETWNQPVFRKAVAMARHNFGRGEYRYYADPLPSPIAELRTTLYAEFLPIANRWAAGLGLAEFPPTFEAFRAAGPGLPTPLLLKYGPGDYNCLHQDLYGARWFPLQAVILLDEPGVDFEGGELVLVEQRPRAQSRPMVVPLRRGDCAVIPTNQRPRQGSRGTHRVTVRHGVSEIRRGSRRALGILFHDAPDPGG